MQIKPKETVGALKIQLQCAVTTLTRLSVEFDERGILGQKCLAELGQARRENENLRTRLADSEETKAQSKGKNQKIQELEEQVANLQNDASRKETENESLRKQLTGKDQAIQTLEERVTNLQTDVSTKERENENLCQQLASTKRDLVKITGQNREKTGEIHMLNEQITKLQKELDDAKSSLEKERNEAKERAKKYDAMHSQTSKQLRKIIERLSEVLLKPVSRKRKLKSDTFDSDWQVVIDLVSETLEKVPVTQKKRKLTRSVAKSTDIRIQHETETAKFHQDSEMLEEVGVTVEHPSGFRGENSMEIHSPSQLNALSVAASISLDILNTIQIPAVASSTNYRVPQIVNGLHAYIDAVAYILLPYSPILDYSAVHTLLDEWNPFNYPTDTDFNNWMFSLLSLGAACCTGVGGFCFVPDISTVDWNVPPCPTAGPHRVCMLFCVAKYHFNLHNRAGTLLPHLMIMCAVAYRILHIGAQYLTKTLKTCSGGYIYLGALHDQIQLMYCEITAMMLPTAFALDLIKDSIPLKEGSDPRLREFLHWFRKVNQLRQIFVTDENRAPISNDESIPHVRAIHDSLRRVKENIQAESSSMQELGRSNVFLITINHVIILEVAIENLHLLARVASQSIHHGSMAFCLYPYWLTYRALKQVGVRSLEICQSILRVHSSVLKAFNLPLMPNHIGTDVGHTGPSIPPEIIQYINPAVLME